MNSSEHFFTYLLIMALVTYFIRAVPFALCTKTVKSRFLKSFLAYVPYTVLGAMTFPAILYATSSVISASVGLIIAIMQAIREKSLIIVAASACAAVYLTELFL